MKKFFIYLAMAAAATALLASCNDKDKVNDEDNSIAKAVEGTYPVSCMVTMANLPMGPFDADVILTKVTDTSVKISLSGLNILGQGSIPVEVASVALSGTNTNATIAYTGNISLTLGETDYSLPGTISGTISPDATSEKVVLTVTADAEQIGEGMGTITIAVTDQAE